jgi:hypothetical protein
MINDPNATPEQHAAAAVESSEASIRRDHIKHEASVKSIGVLYYLGAGLLIIAGILAFVSEEDESLITKVLVGFVLLGLGLLQLCVGWGLRRLRSWSRIPTIILSAIGLLAFPIGTLIHGYIMYLVVCKKGAVVFSDEYKSVIEATPDIRYKTSIVVWILLGILIAIVGLGLIAALLSN